MFSLDPSAPGHSLENAHACALAAKLAYSKQEADVTATVTGWGFDAPKFFDRSGTQAFLAARSDIVLLAFRGTETDELADIRTDASFKFEDGPLGSRVHRGFRKALAHVWDDVHPALDARPLFLTGHSLGAALATLAAAHLLDDGRTFRGIYTFGSPRVGDATFAAAFEGTNTFRYVNDSDVVARIPPYTWGYRHAGTLKYFDAGGQLHDDLDLWDRIRDQVEGAVEELGRIGHDAVGDHGMHNYVTALGRVLADPSLVKERRKKRPWWSWLLFWR